MNGPLHQRPLVRAGVLAWAFLGLVGALWVGWRIVSPVAFVWVPLLLALFPAAVLRPVQRWLEDRGLPPAAAALLLVVGSLVALAAFATFTVVQVRSQVDQLASSLQQGYDQLRTSLARGAYGLPEIHLGPLTDLLRNVFLGSADASSSSGGNTAASVLSTTLHGLAQVALAFLALFFYLKDGERIAAFLARATPPRFRDEATGIGLQVWDTIGRYVRGTATIATVDAVLIGAGLLAIGVPLVPVLTVLVFLGAFIPIVGAFVSGALAVLVAMAAKGLTAALLTFAVIVGVQQLEGHILAPWILGNAVALHPLVVLVALTTGGLLFGVIGTLLAVPITGAGWRAVRALTPYLRGEDEPEPAPG